MVMFTSVASVMEILNGSCDHLTLNTDTHKLLQNLFSF